MSLLFSLKGCSLVVRRFVKVVKNIRQQHEHYILRLLKAIFVCLDVSNLMRWSFIVLIHLKNLQFPELERSLFSNTPQTWKLVTDDSSSRDKQKFLNQIFYLDKCFVKYLLTAIYTTFFKYQTVKTPKNVALLCQMYNSNKWQIRWHCFIIFGFYHCLYSTSCYHYAGLFYLKWLCLFIKIV